MNTLTEPQKAYLAGIMDGDGCITISRSKISRKKVSLSYALLVTITQTDKPYLQRLCDMTGVGHVHLAKQGKRQWMMEKYRANAADVYRWMTTSVGAYELLTAITPYLINKKRQAEIAIQFQKTYHHKPHGQKATAPAVLDFRERCKNDIQSLNQTKVIDDHEVITVVPESYLHQQLTFDLP